MPRDLHDAHRDLSRAVERAYGVRRAFATDRGRMEFLLELYAALIGQQQSIPWQLRVGGLDHRDAFFKTVSAVEIEVETRALARTTLAGLGR